MLAELVFGGTFASLDLEQLAALCSCFVGAERTDKGAKWVTGEGAGGLPVWHLCCSAIAVSMCKSCVGVLLYHTPHMTSL